MQASNQGPLVAVLGAFVFATAPVAVAQAPAPPSPVEDQCAPPKQLQLSLASLTDRQQP